MNQFNDLDWESAFEARKCAILKDKKCCLFSSIHSFPLIVLNKTINVNNI